MNFGFRLESVTVSGPEKPDASVEFAAGLNVVVGPTDTGKSFLFQCVDWCLGASTPPKAITEAAGYTTAELAILTYAGERIVLRRPLAGGDVSMRRGSEAPIDISSQHSAGNDNSLSAVLLAICGLPGKKIRTNKSGAVGTLTIRDVVRFALIDEQHITTSGSPALSGQRVTATREKRAFSVLLTGDDDSQFTNVESPKIRSARANGRREVLEVLLDRTQSAREQQASPSSSLEGARELAELAASRASAAYEALHRQQAASTTAESERRAHWVKTREVDSRLAVLHELQERFALLRTQYDTDLRRLAALAEAGAGLMQLPVEPCPVCGAAVEHQHPGHEAVAGPEDVVAACNAEQAKLSRLLSDLDSTIEANTAEIETLGTELHDRRAALAAADRALEELVRPQLASAAEAYNDAERDRRSAERAVHLWERETELRELLSDEKSVPKRAKKTPLPEPDVTATDARALAKAIEKILRGWHLPGVGDVTFNEETQDIVIGGQARAARGQGTRAITHAAFMLGLLALSLAASRPTAGLLVLDSPLLVYRAPDQDEDGFPVDVKANFYRYIASHFAESQVIVLEHIAPPADAVPANVVTFTKSSVGRYGFFPTTEA